MSIRIAARFNGPPDSANGGYTAGRLAAFVDAPAVGVDLRLPPPLERELEVRAVDGGVELLAGDEVVARAGPLDGLDVGAPEAVSFEAAAEAARTPVFPPERHVFPTCFGCGPDREPGDALRHLPGWVREGELAACPWEIDPALPNDDGALEPEIVWAALDCPTGWAGIPVGSPPHVLARIEARLDAPVRVGERCVCVAWPLGADGRKKWAASAVLGPGGEPRAIARALWIELRRPQPISPVAA